MSSPNYDNFKLFDNNTDLYNSMLEDIKNAKHSIYIEMYRITKEATGKSFIDAFAEAASRGVRIVGLFDAWGTGSSLSFFAPIINKGGQIKIFNKLRIIKLIKSHHRNHRKILVIDEDISYIGSANISNYSKKWRELTLRIKGSLAKPLKKIIKLDFKFNKNLLYLSKGHTRFIHHDGFEIIRDIPSIYKQKVKRKYEYLVKNAKKSIYIETPYFLPGYKLRKALCDSSRRGINITIVLPKHSDVRLVDLLRNKYLGIIYNSGVKIKYYYPNNLHSKLMIIDNSLYCLGSSNFDYRSFRYMHEIIISGQHKDIIDKLLLYKKDTLNAVHDFNYETWKRRPLFERVITNLLIPFRYLF